MIIGIDLGTTNSLAAYYTPEGPKIIPNRLGKKLTPSVVSMDEEEQIYVGDTAVERNLLYPGSTASVFKRDMGSKKQFKLLHKSFTAEELSSFVLRALKEDAEMQEGGLRKKPGSWQGLRWKGSSASLRRRPLPTDFIKIKSMPGF